MDPITHPVPIATFTINPTVDLSVEVECLRPEGKSRARLCSISGGGGGLNVARGVRRLGGTALALHTAGREVGARLNRLLDDEGIAHLPIEIGEDTREAFVVAERESGRSYHVVPAGPTLSAAEERQCLEMIAETVRHCDYFVLSGSATPGLSAGFGAAVAREVAAAGAALIADIAGTQLTTMLAERVFLLRLDRVEAAALIGRPIAGYDDACAANALLLERGACEYAITTVGALGAVCSDSGGHQVIAAPALTAPPRSDACAGDSLVAAITQRLTEGAEVAQACVLGVAAAAATVMLPGTDVFESATVEKLAAQIRPVPATGSTTG
ncbi:1-phosphofructokinase family hexose kinase [Nocardia ignorata]|uniref:1-phosphofructokinase family hexose kinase n=1 Tax=Nocardia ignorata TaxID=145285 RepID=UPI00363EF70D